MTLVSCLKAPLYLSVVGRDRELMFKRCYVGATLHRPPSTPELAHSYPAHTTPSRLPTHLSPRHRPPLQRLLPVDLHTSISGPPQSTSSISGSGAVRRLIKHRRCALHEIVQRLSQQTDVTRRTSLSVTRFLLRKRQLVHFPLQLQVLFMSAAPAEIARRPDAKALRGVRTRPRAGRGSGIQCATCVQKAMRFGRARTRPC